MLYVYNKYNMFLLYKFKFNLFYFSFSFIVFFLIYLQLVILLFHLKHILFICQDNISNFRLVCFSI